MKEAYGEKFQNKDLSQLKKEEESNQNQQITTPEIFDIYPITCW